VRFLVKQGGASSGLDEKHREVQESFKELAESSGRISERINEEKKICESLLAAVDKKTREFEQLMENAETISTSLQTVRATGNHGSKEQKYKLVAKLAEGGMGRDEISKVTGVLKGEVDLILNLSSK
ncbi:MAG: DUF6115 domain-containing protein, partial [Nitrospinota bacterium]